MLGNGYFDHNATAPLCEAAREAWIEASEKMWHNPSSLYREAGMAKLRLEDMREELADALGIDEPERVIFTSGATEANNAVMRYFENVAISAIEHPCVCETARAASILPISEATGSVELESVEALFSTNEIPGLVSVMAANNETGSIQPWQEIGVKCRENGVLFHCDAAQWFGKMGEFESFGETGDFVTGSAHKFGGPMGVGFLTIPEDFDPNFTLASGGPQEHQRRAGTEDLPGIASMMAAFREERPTPNAGLRDQFETDLAEKIKGVKFVGQAGKRLWNTSMFVVPRESNLKWLIRLSRAGFSVSTGSACSAGKGNPSHVMEAMGLDFNSMSRVIRVSSGHDTTAEDWSALLGALVECDREFLSLE
ncbi:MAG: cysteine desulfurase family protein [Verrucomicrobiales bacterium]